jgi:hypothetical protein
MAIDEDLMENFFESSLKEKKTILLSQIHLVLGQNVMNDL